MRPRPIECSLPVDGPLHLQATVRLLQRRPHNPVDRWEEGTYMRLLPTRAGLVLLRVRNEGDIDRPHLRLLLEGPGATAMSEARAVARRLLGLDADPVKFERQAAVLPALRATARALHGMRPPRFASLFEAFLNVVPFQQLSLDAGVATVIRVVERLGDRAAIGGRDYRAFPDARTFGDVRPEVLREAGISRARGECLRGVARRILEGALDEASLLRLSSSEALARLRALPGIGPWSAGLVLLRGLGRVDVFPERDVGVARGLGELLHLSDAAALRAIAERFGEARGYLYYCSLGASLLSRGLIDPAP